MHIYTLALKGWSGVRPVIVAQLSESSVKRVGLCMDEALKNLTGRVSSQHGVVLTVNRVYSVGAVQNFVVEAPVGGESALETLHQQLQEIGISQKVVPQNNHLEWNILI